MNYYDLWITEDDLFSEAVEKFPALKKWSWEKDKERENKIDKYIEENRYRCIDDEKRTNAEIDGVSECCAAGTAVVIQSENLEEIIKAAIVEEISLLNFYIVPKIESNRKLEEQLVGMPGVHFVTEIVNPSTGNTIRQYVLNLREEW